MSNYTRQALQEELRIRGYSERTVEIYTYHMVNFAEYFNMPPHTLTPQHIQEYQVFLVQQKQVSWTHFNQAVCALRFFLTMW